MSEIFKQLALLGDIWVLWALVAASFISLGVIGERWWNLRHNKINFKPFFNSLMIHLEKGDLHGARKLAQQHKAAEARIFLAGLDHFSKGAVSVEKAMLASLVQERSDMERNLIVLGTLGNNAPFIGLFGTVLGIIKAFNDLAVSGSGGIAIVMTGISSALVATAFGILVAIPAVMANNYFYTRAHTVGSNAQSLIHMLQVVLNDSSQKVSGSKILAEAFNN
jgi:biopolymer transport protein ExbB